VDRLHFAEVARDFHVAKIGKSMANDQWRMDNERNTASKIEFDRKQIPWRSPFTMAGLLPELSEMGVGDPVTGHSRQSSEQNQGRRSYSG
jgi:hypothetical protein